jgi:hypothetical protein
MATPPNQYAVSMNTLKSRILNPSLTSHYSVVIDPPSTAPNNGTTITALYKEKYPDLPQYDKGLMELTCTEASLPGSNMGTIETMDYTGVTEKHAYRRIFDDTIDFTFIVTQDSNYHQIRFFDLWMSYILREGEIRGLTDLNKNIYYRARYAEDYQGTIAISKFEKNMGYNNTSPVPILTYRFIGAYPKQINSIPISYEASELLKVTVSFTYTRYFVDRQLIKIGGSNSPVPSPQAPANPAAALQNPQAPSTQSWRYSQAELEAFRGAAALSSIASSRNADRLLSGQSGSSAANRIVDQSYNRVLYGSPTPP